VLEHALMHKKSKVVSMGLEKVIEKIQNEGKEKITSIIQDAEKQAAQILQTKQKTLEELSVKKKQEIEKQIETLKTQEESGIEIEIKKIKLNAEKDVLNATYQECLNALSTLPHEKMISFLLKKVETELPEAAYIYSNKRDEAIVRAHTKISYGESIETLGGIIVENREKTMKVDYRYETIAEIVWDRSLKEIAEKLFK
jgi:V/A-type H+-transporting ATPase subunit E